VEVIQSKLWISQLTKKLNSTFIPFAICMLLVSENLQRYFSRYGDVIDCVVMKNSESGRSRGFGFVTFSDPANVSLVLQSGPHQLDGRTVRNKFASLT